MHLNNYVWQEGLRYLNITTFDRGSKHLNNSIWHGSRHLNINAFGRGLRHLDV